MTPRVWSTIAWLMAGVLAIMLIYVIVAIRVTQLQISDCTQAGGKCYARGQKQTAGAVQLINQIVILSISCDDTVSKAGTTKQIEQRVTACVHQELARPQG